jgi:uncharacterized alkaline shock family protein YloU
MKGSTKMSESAAANETGNKSRDTERSSGRRVGDTSSAVGAGASVAHASLPSDRGRTRIADNVVAKIAGMAAREIPGVHSMGTGFARRVGQLRSIVPGTADAGQLTQGVEVEVGEREAAIDLDLVIWYGQSIVDVADGVRANVITRLETMLRQFIVEVNINIDDIYVEGLDVDQTKPRVQ